MHKNLVFSTETTLESQRGSCLRTRAGFLLLSERNSHPRCTLLRGLLIAWVIQGKIQSAAGYGHGAGGCTGGWMPLRSAEGRIELMETNPESWRILFVTDLLCFAFDQHLALQAPQVPSITRVHAKTAGKNTEYLGVVILLSVIVDCMRKWKIRSSCG